MRFLSAAFARFAGLFAKSSRDRDWDEEIQAHLRMHIEDNLRAGMDPVEARRAALLKFGGIETAREACRDRRGLPWLETLLQDLRYALRTFAREPGFTAVVVLTLALGVGANTAMFSLVDTVMLKLLPVSRPEQLFYVYTSSTQVGTIKLSRTILNRDLAAMHQGARRLASISSYAPASQLNVGVNGHSALASGHFVGGDYFHLLGVQPILGRAIQPSDQHADGRVALISFGYWQRRFGADAGVLGKAITISGVPFTIVGVTPREFYGLDADAPADLLLPYATIKQIDAGQASSEEPKPDDSPDFVLARVKPGVTRQSAEAELAAIYRQAERAAGGSVDQLAFLDKLTMDLQPASKALSSARNRFSEPLRVLMVVVALVMLIACANIANLLLAKSGVRRREIAIRLSLGSSRLRLIRQLLTESLLLSLFGGLLGVLLAVWLRAAIVYLASPQDGAIPIPAEWNLRVFAFTAAVCLLNAVFFGLAPALRATAVDLVSPLKGVFRPRPGRLRLGKVLVAGQVALSLTLLVAAGLFLGTFRNLERIDLGFDRDRVLMLTLDPTMAGYRGPKAAQVFQTALDRTAAIPGVQAVTLLRDRMLTGQISMSSLWVPGYALRSDENAANQWVISNAVGPRFFAIAGMHLIAGRDFSERDNLAAPQVAVVNQTMARHYFAGGNPLGQRIARSKEGPPIEIVGVVRDTAYMNVRTTNQDVLFTPILQTEADSCNSATIFIRTADDSPRVAQDVRAAMQAVDPNLPPIAVRTMHQQVANTLIQQRLLATLSAFFGALALALSAVGLYGVISYGIAQRTAEIGLRMALGASRASILNLTLGETARLTAAGMALGLAIALVCCRFVAGLLYGIAPTDTASLGGSAALLTVVALLAGFIPGRRASRVDPITALRFE
jgi:predicted permease